MSCGGCCGCACEEWLSPDNVILSLGTPGTDEYKRRFIYACSVFTEVIKSPSFVDDVDERTLLALVREQALDVADELDLFKAVCKWGIARCQKKGLQPTPSNLREVCVWLARLVFMCIAIRRLTALFLPPLLRPACLRQVLAAILPYVRFPLMSVDALAGFVTQIGRVLVSP